MQPALDSLAISITGLGPIVVGEEPPASDPLLDTVRLDLDACQNLDNPDSPIWLANYPDSIRPHSDRTGPAFYVFTEGGLVTGVSIYSPEPTTADGVHVGMTRDDLVAAHPDAGITQTGPLGDIYVEKNPDTILVFEVLRQTNENYYYGAEQVDTVLKIKVVSNVGEPMPSATWDGCG